MRRNSTANPLHKSYHLENKDVDIIVTDKEEVQHDNNEDEKNNMGDAKEDDTNAIDEMMLEIKFMSLKKFDEALVLLWQS